MADVRRGSVAGSWRRLVFAALAVAAAIGCSPQPEDTGPGTVRLVDAFDAVTVVDSVEVAREHEAVAHWRFDGVAPDQGDHRATFGWRALTGVAGLRVDDGRLVGTVTGDPALLHVERRGPPPGEDQLHSVAVRLHMGGGDTVGAAFFSGERLDEASVLEQAQNLPPPWRATISPAEGVVLHELRSSFTQRASGVRHLLLSLSGAEGEPFALEEVRVVSDREHLSAIAAGVGWQGLTDVYRETLVARSPERLQLPITVPAAEPWLDLEVGTPESYPVRFRVRAGEAGAPPGEGALIADRLVTTPHRWEPAPVDLSPWAGRQVTLELAIEAEEPGVLGYWGSPVIRSRRPDGEHPRGVILLLADTLRPDHLAAHGYQRDTSPTLARLAAEGVHFSDVVAQGTWTKVSVPSIVTSLLPTSHGLSDFDHRLSDTAVTLAELYRDAGYATAAFSSVIFTGKLSNLQQGYEVLHERSSVPSDGYPAKTARVFVDRAVQWLEAHRDVPFFLFLHVFDPHDPFKPRPPEDVRWGDPEAEERHRQWQEAVREVIDDPLLRAFGMPTRAHLERAGIDPEEYVRLNVDWYDGSIRGMDTEIARLTGQLEALGLADRVVIAFTSDHGEEFLEHGRTFHGQSVYGELAQIPLFFWGPGHVPAGKVVEHTVRGIDIMPTLLEVSGLPLPPFLQGQSLRSLWARENGAASNRGGQRWRPAPALVEKAKTEGAGAPAPRDTESFALVSEGWKLIHHRVRPEGAPEYELFDHAADPLNLRDLAPQHPERVERLAGELQKLLEWAEARRLPEAERAEDLTADERERLRALGYL